MDEPSEPTTTPLEVTPASTRDQLREVRDDEDPNAGPLLLDCRTEAEARVARIEGSTLIPMNELPERIGELAHERGRSIIVYCHHGVRSLRVAAYLREQGFERAQSMRGGIDAWSQTIDPSIPRY